MATQQVVLDQIEITRTGRVQVRLSKQVVLNGRVLLSEPHRVAMDPGADVAATMATVNAHLASMETPWPAVSDKDIASIAAQASVAWTPEVIAAAAASVPKT